jgi:hypothetical protein
MVCVSSPLSGILTAMASLTTATLALALVLFAQAI